MVCNGTIDHSVENLHLGNIQSQLMQEKSTTVDLTSEHVRAARALLKWTQEELAQRSGVGVTTINLWENDKTRPSRETRDQIFVAFVSADIEFWNGGNPGVRLIRNREG